MQTEVAYNNPRQSGGTDPQRAVLLKTFILLVTFAPDVGQGVWRDRRVALGAERTGMESLLCTEALPGWKGMQTRKEHGICCFFSCSTSLKKLIRNIWLNPRLASKTAGHISHTQEQTHSHLDQVLKPFHTSQTRDNFPSASMKRGKCFEQVIPGAQGQCLSEGQ